MPLFKSHSFKGFASVLVGITGALINITLIMTFGHIYESLALRLTQWEMHRTQTEFDNHLTFKVFIFHFVNYYASIFYVAFFKQRFNGPPNNYSLLLGIRSEEVNWLSPPYSQLLTCFILFTSLTVYSKWLLNGTGSTTYDNYIKQTLY